MKLIRPKKIRAFDYKTFTASLLLDTKSLEITFRREHLDSETADELLDIFSWCEQHLEVKAILFNHQNPVTFIKGLNSTELEKLSKEEIILIFSKFFTLNIKLKSLAQTIITDMKNGCDNEALIFSMCADIKLANSDATFSFNQIGRGLIDGSGLFSILCDELNINILRSILLSGIEFSNKEFEQLGMHLVDSIRLPEILENIFKQSDLSRLQTKSSIAATNKNGHPNRNQELEKIFLANFVSEDFKNQGKFRSLREIKIELN
jgi:enoyl-CoA hydratase/carnithine racemase